MCGRKFGECSLWMSVSMIELLLRLADMIGHSENELWSSSPGTKLSTIFQEKARCESNL